MDSDADFSLEKMSKEAERARQEIFGFSGWRGCQENALKAYFEEKDSLIVMPTGMGKSLCYQIPAAIFEKPGFVLVISPLIALMKDQVDALQRKGMRAAAINSSLRRDERDKVLERLSRGKLQILYATPERFRSEEFWEAILVARSQGAPIKLLAIDEAHCISTWGHDFRLDYSRLGDYRKQLGNPPTMALTATATAKTQEDILAQLGILDASRFVTSIWRPNLAIEILEVSGLDEKVRAFVMNRHRYPGPAILYFSLIQTLSKFSDAISALGFEHALYHGQLGDRIRKKEQERFISGNVDLMLATPAFGLGIDKADVRLLMHIEMPGSMEAYYQEIGRAGRDGTLAHCVGLFDPDDVSIQSDFVKWSAPDPGFLQAVLNLIERNELRARQEGFDYLRSQMNFYNSRDFRVETSVALLERWGALSGREPREWKVEGEIPSEYLDQKRYQENLKHREEKLLELVQFFSEKPWSGELLAHRGMERQQCRLVRVANAFGENLPTTQRCGVCDYCLANSVLLR